MSLTKYVSVESISWERDLFNKNCKTDKCEMVMCILDAPWNINHSFPPLLIWASIVAQTVKNLPAMQAMWVPSLGWEDPLEKEMATHSSILIYLLFNWRIIALQNFIWHSSILVANPMNGGAWWTTVHGVAKSWTRLSDKTTILPEDLLCVRTWAINQIEQT